MTKRFYTFIVVPYASSSLHKIRVPVPVVQMLAIVGVISVVAALALGFTYAKLAFKVADYNDLQAENKELKVEKKNLEVTTKKLSSKISALEDLSERLTTMIESDDWAKRFGNIVGGVGGSRVDYRTADIIGSESAFDMDTLKNRTTELESQMKLIEQIAEKRAILIRSTPTIWPLKGNVGSHFGSRMDPFTGDSEMHLGIDISGLYGTPVQSPADGLVIFASRKTDYGNLVIIDHGKGLTTRFGHLSRFAVRVGQKIQKGELLGYVAHQDGPQRPTSTTKSVSMIGR